MVAVFLNARTLLLICWASGCWAFSFGLGSQVVTHWLNAREVNNTIIGLTHSFYYFGVALGSCAVPWLNRRLGPIPCAALGMTFSGCTLALFPWGDDVWAWYLLRLLNGCASGMSLVPLETIVSRDSHPDKKTEHFGYYGLALTIGGAIGIWMGLHLYHPGRTLAFYLGGAVPIVTGALLAAGMRRYRISEESTGPRHPLGWGSNFLSYGTAWCQGFLEGGMLAFLSLFLLARGFTPDEAGMFMSVTMVGLILFQVPVSWLADRWGRIPVLLSCYAMVAMMLGTIPWLESSSTLAISLFVLGACSGAMYPLGLAMLGERMPASALARAYAWYLAVECVGSQVGAAAMGKARDRWGERSMFAVGLAAVVLVILIWLPLRHFLSRREQGEQEAASDAPEHQQAA
jgi:MFS family permease